MKSFVFLFLVSLLCFNSSLGRSHGQIKHTAKTEIHSSHILPKTPNNERNINVEKNGNNTNENLTKEVVLPGEVPEIQENDIEMVPTEDDLTVQENDNKIEHPVSNKHQLQHLEEKVKVEEGKKQTEQLHSEDELLQNEQLNGENNKNEHQDQKEATNQRDEQDEQDGDQQQVDKENQEDQQERQQKIKNQIQEDCKEQALDQEQKHDQREQPEEEETEELKQGEQSKQPQEQQFDDDQPNQINEKAEVQQQQQQQRISGSDNAVLKSQEHGNKIINTTKKEENHATKDNSNIKRQNIDLYEEYKSPKKEQKGNNVSSQSESEINISNSVKTSSDHLEPKSEQIMNNNNNKNNDNKNKNVQKNTEISSHHLDENENTKEDNLIKQNTNKKSENDQHQKIKSKHNNKNVNKENLKKPILHPLADAKHTFHKNSEVENIKNTSTKNSNNGLITNHDTHDSQETNQDMKKAIENNPGRKIIKAELLKKLEVHETENNQSEHSKVLNKLGDDKATTVNVSKLQNKNKYHGFISHHRGEHINRDQGPEKLKDIVKTKSLTHKTSNPQQNTKEEAIIKEEALTKKQEEKQEELVIKLRSELEEQEDKYLQKEKQNRIKSVKPQSKHKKKYSAAIITISLTLIISTVILSIAGVYYSKISLGGRRYYGHTLLPTEEDISLYTRTNYNEDDDRYESWRS